MLKARHSYNSFFRQLLFILVLLAIGLLLLFEIKFFIGAFLGGITLYVVFRRFMFRLLDQKHWPAWIASLFIVFITTVLLSGFGFVVYKAVQSGVTDLDPQKIFSSFNGFIDQMKGLLGVQKVPDNLLEKSEGIITKFVSALFNSTYSFTANVVMMLFILYFMLSGCKKMEANFKRYSPFKSESLCLIKREVRNMIFSNAVLMPIILVAQTLTSVLIYWLVGMDNYFFWGFLTALAGLIPVVGTMIVYVPIAIYMIASGDLWNGLIVFGYGAVVISNTDNLFRILFMRSVADTHPLIVIFGVLIGIPLFGFWGIIFGPLLISGFILLIRIYYVEYGLIDPQQDKEYVRKIPKHLKGFAARTQRKSKYEECRVEGLGNKNLPDADN